MPESQVPFVGNFNFLVEIDGVANSSSVVGGFSSVAGVGSDTDVIEHAVGSSATTVKVPGRTSFSNIVLSQGVTNSEELYKWRRAVEQGKTDRRSGSIILLNPDMTERTRWNFFNAWPCRYDAPDMDASGSAVSIERLELCVESVERVSSD